MLSDRPWSDKAPPARAFKGVANAFWSLLLAGSVGAIGVGFASGHRLGTTVLRPRPVPVFTAPAELPPARRLDRVLRGPGSLEADDDVDRWADSDRAVAARPAGWAPLGFDDRHARPRLAVLVVAGDRDATALAVFADEPYPLAVLVPAQDGLATLRVARNAGKTALVDCAAAEAATVAALRRAGAAGVACSTGEPERARAIVAANRGGLVFDDLLAADALYRAARDAGGRAVTRDVVADARDEPPYVDFLFAQALAIARRTGVATVVVHARPGSLAALERCAARAERDGIDLVPLAQLAR